MSSIRHKVTVVLGSIIFAREDDAPEYRGSVAKAMLERGQFDAWVKGSVVTRVVMPLNFEQQDIACGTKMGNTKKRIKMKFQSNQIPSLKLPNQIPSLEKLTIGPHL